MMFNKTVMFGLQAMTEICDQYTSMSAWHHILGIFFFYKHMAMVRKNGNKVWPDLSFPDHALPRL